MNIFIYVTGEIVIDDMSDIRNIKTACGYLELSSLLRISWRGEEKLQRTYSRSHKDRVGAASEEFQITLSLELLQVSMDRHGTKKGYMNANGTSLVKLNQSTLSVDAEAHRLTRWLLV